MPTQHTPEDDWVYGHKITPAEKKVTSSIKRTDIYTPNFWLGIPLQLGWCVWAYKNGDPDNTRTANPVPEDNGKYLVYYYIVRNRKTIYLTKMLGFTQEERDAGIPNKNGADRVHHYIYCATRMAEKIQVTIP